MRCLAALCAIEFIIALPDRAAVFVCRVPDLGAEELAAVTADDFTGENTAASVTPSEFLASGKFLLHPVKKLRCDDGFMAVLYIVLWNLALIDFHLFLKGINVEAFLAAGWDLNLTTSGI